MSPSPAPRSEEGPWGKLPLLLILATAAYLRINHLGSASLWHDEAATTWFASLSLAELFSTLRFEQNPPLFYLLAKVWLPWSKSEVWLRLLPLIFGLASVAVAFWAAREIWRSKAAGLMAAVLVALSTDQILISQTFRGYSLLFLLTMATIFFGWRWGRGGRRGDLVGATILAALAFYDHYIFIFYLPGLGLTVLGLILGNGETRRRRLSDLVRAGVAFLVLISPGLYLFSLNAGQVVESFWIPELSWALLGRYLAGMVMSHNLGLVFHLAALILALAFPDRRTGLLLILIYLPILLIALVSWTVKPIMIPRVIAPAGAGLVLLGARLGQLTLEGLTARLGRITGPLGRAWLIVALCVLGGGGFLLLHGQYEKENWRELTRTVIREYREGDLVAFCPGTIEWSFNWYQAAYSDLEMRKIGLPHRLRPGQGLPRNPGGEKKDLERFWAGLDQAKRLWLIQREGYWLDQLDPAKMKEGLEARGKLELEVDLGEIQVKRYLLR